MIFTSACGEREESADLSYNRSVGRGCAQSLRPMYAEANMGHPSRTMGFLIHCLIAPSSIFG
jgi:hypothetical protein